MSVFRTTVSKEGVAMNTIGRHCRKNIKTPVVNYNYPAIVNLAFNDAMTYNPETKKGGAVMTHKFSSQKLKKYNLPFLNVLEELIYHKQHEADYRFDVLSLSDYLQAHSIVAIKDAQGPDLTEYHRIGRQDIESEEDLEGIAEVPQPEDGVVKFKDAFLSKGFVEKDIVALSAIYMYGVYRSHYEKTYTEMPVFKNEYFKYLNDNQSSNKHALDKILLGDAALKEYVELFAKDRKEFFEAFTDAYLRLYTLGNDDKQLHLTLPDYDY